MLEKLLQLSNVVYVVGVVAAAVATFAIYHLSARVNAAKDDELATYRTQSAMHIADARAEAAEAMKVAAAERRARAELESQVAAAEARAAEANAIASEAQLELARLTEPRTIAPADQEKIIVALTELAGQHYGFSVFSDPEALALVRVLDTLLKSAGWLRVSSQIGDIEIDVAGNTAGTSHDSGVTALIGPEDGDLEAALLALSGTLTTAGIPCGAAKTEQLRGKIPRAIIINVGKKL